MSNKMETPQQVFVGRNALFFVIICLLFLRVNDRFPIPIYTDYAK